MNGTAFPVSQIDWFSVLIITSVVLMVTLIALLFFFISKNEAFRELKNAYDKIMLNFDELDEQEHGQEGQRHEHHRHGDVDVEQAAYRLHRSQAHQVPAAAARRGMRFADSCRHIR